MPQESTPQHIAGAILVEAEPVGASNFVRRQDAFTCADSLSLLPPPDAKDVNRRFFVGTFRERKRKGRAVFDHGLVPLDCV